MQVLEIKPRDEFRYGYMLWLDQETAMPLQSQLIDEQGEVVEQILFTEIEIPADIPAGPRSSRRSTRRASRRCARRSPTPLAAEIPWRAAAVPGGFRLSVATQSPIAGSDTPVEHLVYSDGLATVSVFIEDPATKAEVRRGFLHRRQHERVLVDAARTQGHGDGRGAAANRANDRFVARRRVARGGAPFLRTAAARIGVVRAVRTGDRVTVELDTPPRCQGCGGACLWYRVPPREQLTLAASGTIPVGATVDRDAAGALSARSARLSSTACRSPRCSSAAALRRPSSAPISAAAAGAARRCSPRCWRRRRCAGGSSEPRCGASPCTAIA